MSRIESQLVAQGANWSELARRVGKTTSAASQWSSRRAVPRLQTMHAIAKELGVALSWLLAGEAVAEAAQADSETEREMLALLRQMSHPERKAALAAARRIVGSMNAAPLKEREV
jgi:transcriptional regulator with XRE-family HTH domain